MMPHTHPRLLIGMPAPAIREMLHLLRAHCSLHIGCMRVLAERVACAARIKALHCASAACKALSSLLVSASQSENCTSGHVLCVTICTAPANYAEAGYDAQFA